MAQQPHGRSLGNNFDYQFPHVAGPGQARRRLAARYNLLLGGVSGLVTSKVATRSDQVTPITAFASVSGCPEENLADGGTSTVLHYPRVLPLYLTFPTAFIN